MINTLLTVMFSLSLFLPAYSQQESMVVIDVDSQEDDRIYYMDATIETQLPEYVKNAFYNGVPLPLLIQIEVREEIDWWFNQSLVTIEQFFLLHYYPLYDSVRTENLTNGSSANHRRLALALKQLGTIRRYPILDKENFEKVERINARIRLKIDSTRLPKPLRTASLLGGSWDISSDWKEWKLR